MKALIDADILLYRAGHQTEKPIDWGDDVWTLHADFREAKTRFLALVENSTPEDATDVVLCLSDDILFRHDIYPEYKGNRTGRKPVTHRALKDWIIEGDHSYEVQQWPMLEADDVMGLIQTNARVPTVICTIDKDLLQIPGDHYNFDTRERKTIGNVEAYKFFLQQCISGDATDGIPGIRGVGPKKARAHLEKHGYTFQSVVEAYESAGMCVNAALINAWLVNILHDGHYAGRKVWVQPYERPLAELMKLRDAKDYYGILQKEEFSL